MQIHIKVQIQILVTETMIQFNNEKLNEMTFKRFKEIKE